MAGYHRGLAPVDVRDFEPRPSTPINSRSSPDKTVICSGFSPVAPVQPRHSVASSTTSSGMGGTPKSRKSKAALAVEGLLGGRDRDRTPFTPVRMSRKRAESVSPAMLAGHDSVPEDREQVEPRSVHASMLPLTAARPTSMLLSPTTGLPVPQSPGIGRQYRPSVATPRSPQVHAEETGYFSSPLAREVTPFPAPAPPPFSPPPFSPPPSSFTPRLPTQTLPPSPSPRASPLAASPSTPKIRAKLTPIASPRRKPLLPGAPNPEHLPSRPSSPTKAPSSAILATQHRLRAAASVPALRSQLTSAASEGWITGGRPSALSGAGGLGIHVSPQPCLQDSWTAEAPAARSNVLVCIRVRPANHATSKALTANGGDPEVDGSDAWVVDERGGGLVEASGMHAGILGGPMPDQWRFDAVRSGSDNASVYDVAARDLVMSCMHGYDTSIFAYGQTASGKTFTLTGAASNPGVIPLAIRDVFAFIRRHPTRDFLLRASYLELYNETLRDLLSDDSDAGGAQVRVRQDPATGNFFAANVREEVVSCEAHVEALLKRGEAKRRVAGTEWNARSSRSHTVFAVVVESREGGVGDGGAVRMSRLSLIDLAGSERAAGQQERRAEGAFINKSLLTLEKVIAALAESSPASPAAQPPHVPYRDSKLTQLLQPSLSGNARVAVVCTVNPSSWAVEESRSTLRFARRCKKVQVRAEVNEVVSEKALITRYRAQIADLQAQLATAVSQAPAPSSAPSTPRQPSSASSTSSNADEVDSKAREKRRRERERAEKERAELKMRLEKLQGIVLNASNVDRRRRAAGSGSTSGDDGSGEEEGPRPVSPVKGLRGGGGSDDSEDEDSTGKIPSPPMSRELKLENEVSSLRRELGVLRDELTSRPSVPSSATPEEVDVRVTELEREVLELRVVVANADAEAVREQCAREWEVEREDLRDEMRRRKGYEDELRRELEEARARCKKLELYIIDELSHSASALARPRRSSLGSTLGYTLSTSTARLRRLSSSESTSTVSDEFGVRKSRPSRRTRWGI